MLDWETHVETFVAEMGEILSDRGKEYQKQGEQSRQENFDTIGLGWSKILAVPVSGRQVALCMIWMKVAREISSAKHDSMVDIANYALIADSLDAP